MQAWGPLSLFQSLKRVKQSNVGLPKDMHFHAFSGKSQMTYQQLVKARACACADNTAKIFPHHRTLHDASLFDAELTDLGREQAHATGEIFRKIIDDDENHGHIPKPTEAMASPLSRCLETADIALKHINVEDDDHFTRALIMPHYLLHYHRQL